MNRKRTSGSSPLQNGGGILLFLRLKVIPNIQNQTLQEIIAAYFEKNTVIERDGCKSYLNLKDKDIMRMAESVGENSAE